MGDFKVFFGPFSQLRGSKNFGVKNFGGQNFWWLKVFGCQNFWGQSFWGSKFVWGQKILEYKFSSYIFIKSLIQNQTKLEFDFKDPVLFDFMSGQDRTI